MNKDTIAKIRVAQGFSGLVLTIVTLQEYHAGSPSALGMVVLGVIGVGVFWAPFLGDLRILLESDLAYYRSDEDPEDGRYVTNPRKAWQRVTGSGMAVSVVAGSYGGYRYATTIESSGPLAGIVPLDPASITLLAGFVAGVLGAVVIKSVFDKTSELHHRLVCDPSVMS